MCERRLFRAKKRSRGRSLARTIITKHSPRVDGSWSITSRWMRHPPGAHIRAPLNRRRWPLRQRRQRRQGPPTSNSSRAAAPLLSTCEHLYSKTSDQNFEDVEWALKSYTVADRSPKHSWDFETTLWILLIRDDSSLRSRKQKLIQI